MNTYDNTLLYTDFLLSRIIESLKAIPNYTTALLYVSDHGESLGENGIYLHGMPYFLAPREQTHVPAIFWSNDNALNQIANNHKNSKLSHGDLFDTLLGFFGVQTKDYQADDDFLSPNFREDS